MHHRRHTAAARDLASQVVEIGPALLHALKLPGALGIAVLIVLGCSGSESPTGPAADCDGELRGSAQLIAETGQPASDLVWDAAAGELFYNLPFAGGCTGCTHGIRAVAATAGATPRVIFEPRYPGFPDRVGTGKLPYYLQRSGPGDLLYFVVTFDTTRIGHFHHVLRVDGKTPDAAPEIVLTHEGLGSPAVSADGRFVALDDRLYDIVNRSSLPLPAGRPLDFSPDASQLLMAFPFSVVSTIDGSARTISFPWERLVRDLSKHRGGLEALHYWIGNEPQFVLEDVITVAGTRTSKISLYDTRTGSEHAIASVRNDWVGYDSRLEGVISPDGRRLAVWTGIELVQGHCRGQESVSRQLNVITAATGDAALVATHTRARGGPPGSGIRTTFALTGQKIAFVWGARIYVVGL